MSKVNWQRWRIVEIGLLLLSIAGAILVAEGMLRLGIRLGLGRLQDPSLYTHPFCDDDYHKLRFLWSRPNSSSSAIHDQHPLLGWVPALDDPGQEGTKDAGAKPVLALFGDSFVAGAEPAAPSERLRSLLQDRMPNARVLDFSVSGYGVDQIYLRSREELAPFADQPGTMAVFGILLDDLDRVIETFREGPKPYFVTVGDTIELRGVPVDQTSEDWIERHPVKFRSFLVAMGKRWLADGREWRDNRRTVFEDECRREEKEALNREILSRLVGEARAIGVQPIFVIFYSEHALAFESWKEEFLKTTLSDLGVAVLDTRNPLSAAAADGHLPSYFYFPPPNGHLNPAGNALVADAIAELLAERPTTSTPPPSLAPWKASVHLGDSALSTTHLLRQGWTSESSDFGWTSSTEASVQLPAPPVGRPTVLEIEAICALQTANESRVLSIAVNDQVIRQGALTDFPRCWPTLVESAFIRMDLPGVPVDRPSVEVSILLDSLLTPGEAGLESLDTRRMGIAVKSISLYSIDNP